MSQTEHDTVFGIHAVESMIKKDADAIISLKVAHGRDDKRLARLMDYAGRQGISVEYVPRKELDTLVRGRHQGVVALIKPMEEKLKPSHLTLTRLSWA
jgi:23S rRNA (guanosine2251-2'-O)-methyltransferase